jgi:hypothetical protein
LKIFDGEHQGAPWSTRERSGAPGITTKHQEAPGSNRVVSAISCIPIYKVSMVWYGMVWYGIIITNIMHSHI